MILEKIIYKFWSNDIMIKSVCEHPITTQVPLKYHLRTTQVPPKLLHGTKVILISNYTFRIWLKFLDFKNWRNDVAQNVARMSL